MERDSRFLLDSERFEDLKAYLEDKRSALRDALLFSVSAEKFGGVPILPEPKYTEDSFSYAISEFRKRASELDSQELKRVDYEMLVERFSNILWNYVEILEGMCRELFDQASSVPIDLWDQELFDRLESAKVFLWDKLKEIDAFLNSMDKALKDFILLCLKGRPLSQLKKLRVKLHKVLDPELLERIRKSEIYLHNEFAAFSKDYAGVKKIEGSLEIEQYKFQGYAVLNNLNLQDVRLYLRLWRLLQVWKKADDKLKAKVAFTIKRSLPEGKVLRLFQDYIKEIKSCLFDVARRHRLSRDLGAQVKIALWRGELYALLKTVDQYQSFLAPPKSKSSFFKRKADKPPMIQELNRIKEEILHIDKCFQELFDAQERGNLQENEYALSCFSRASRILQDMGQPLISRAIMQSKSDQLIKTLREASELTSTLPEVSQLMLERLLRAFRVDEKHETLTETPGFWQLWEIHHGLSYENLSPAHQKRMRLYKQVTDHLKGWIEEHGINHHLQEIGHEIHDIQEALQEFYHQSKQVTNGHEKWELKKELLVERVFFSNFFAWLKPHNHEGKRIRTEFTFLEKYFNAIDENLFGA